MCGGVVSGARVMVGVLGARVMVGLLETRDVGVLEARGVVRY